MVNSRVRIMQALIGCKIVHFFWPAALLEGRSMELELRAEKQRLEVLARYDRRLWDFRFSLPYFLSFKCYLTPHLNVFFTFGFTLKRIGMHFLSPFKWYPRHLTAAAIPLPSFFFNINKRTTGCFNPFLQSHISVHFPSLAFHAVLCLRGSVAVKRAVIDPPSLTLALKVLK